MCGAGRPRGARGQHAPGHDGHQPRAQGRRRRRACPSPICSSSCSTAPPAAWRTEDGAQPTSPTLDPLAPSSTAHATDWLRHSLTGLAVIGGCSLGLGAAGWAIVQRSSYFNIRTVEATETAHLQRDAIVTLAGLDGPVNLFRYDALAAEEALGTHPWVANARVEKRMPDRVEIHLTERLPAAVVALGSLYVVDADGQPFIRATPEQAQGLPLVTGLDREQYDTNPVEDPRARPRRARPRPAVSAVGAGRGSPVEQCARRRGRTPGADAGQVENRDGTG
jgi:hypothetical protein